MNYSKIIFSFLLALSFPFFACEEESLCPDTLWYQDLDGDGLGNPDQSISACEQPSGYVSNANDTDDDVSGGIVALGDALSDQINAGDGAGIDNAFRNSGIVIDEVANTYFAVNGVHPINSGDYSSYYPKSIVEASLDTDEIVNVWSFDANTLGRQIDMEGLAFAENTDFLYIGDEYNFIYELDLNSGQVTREWDLAEVGISTSTDQGVEALTYLDGYFYAGVQADQSIYQLDLHLDANDPNDADYQKVESVSSFSVGVSPSGLFGASDGSIYMIAVTGDQVIYNYSSSGTLNCTYTLPGSLNLQRADGIYIDSSGEYAYIADSQGMLNGLSSVYKIPWETSNCQ